MYPEPSIPYVSAAGTGVLATIKGKKIYRKDYVKGRSEEKGTCYSSHHPQFNIDEDMMEHGVALHAQYAYDYLNEK
ncbi:MAG: hypothetical protein ACOX3L_11950 [Lutisporaceae bacterium]